MLPAAAAQHAQAATRQQFLSPGPSPVQQAGTTREPLEHITNSLAAISLQHATEPPGAPECLQFCEVLQAQHPRFPLLNQYHLQKSGHMHYMQSLQAHHTTATALLQAPCFTSGQS